MSPASTDLVNLTRSNPPEPTPPFPGWVRLGGPIAGARRIGFTPADHDPDEPIARPLVRSSNQGARTVIHGTIGGGGVFGDLAQQVRRMANPDLRPLGEEIRLALVTGLTRQAKAGVDSQGRRLAPLAESTRSKRGHDDEPLQHNGSPAFLDSLRVELAYDRGRITVNVLWDHPAAALTAKGTPRQPARDIFTPDAQTWDEVNRIVDDWITRFLHGDA